MKDYEQIISMLLTKIAELEQIVKQRAVRITDLERGLNNDSSNSSKSPSSDGLGKLQWLSQVITFAARK